MDYSIYTEVSQIRIIMYKDIIEIISDGGLYGRLTLSNLGKTHADTRNQILANILEVQKVTENRYSGIPTIRVEMEKYQLPEPIFTNDRGYVIVTLKKGMDFNIANNQINNS